MGYLWVGFVATVKITLIRKILTVQLDIISTRLWPKKQKEPIRFGAIWRRIRNLLSSLFIEFCVNFLEKNWFSASGATHAHTIRQTKKSFRGEVSVRLNREGLYFPSFFYIVCKTMLNQAFFLPCTLNCEWCFTAFNAAMHICMYRSHGGQACRI